MKKGKVLIGIGALCILAAIILAGYNMLESIKAQKAANSVVSGFNEQLDTLTYAEEKEGYVFDKSTGQMEVLPMPVFEDAGKEYIGIIEILSMNLNLPVVSSFSYANLKNAPCLYSGSYYSDDMVICGHNYSSQLGKLNEISPGTEILLVTADSKVYTYEVDYVEYLRPTQITEMITAEDKWDMTLFTCNTSGRLRQAVRCYRKSNPKVK